MYQQALELLYQVNQHNIVLWVEPGQKLKYKLLQDVPDKAAWFAKITQLKTPILEILSHSGITDGDRKLPIIYRWDSAQAPLSYAQQRLYFINEFEQGSSAYNIHLTVKLGQDVNIEKFHQAIRAVVDRHDVLRTVIKVADNEQAYQTLSDAELIFDYASPSSQTEFDQQLQHASYYQFDLANELPLRISQFDFAGDIYVLFNFHHIAFDGWSTAILFDELKQYYYHLLLDKPLQLAPLTIQYRDFAQWQRANHGSAGMQQQLNYWCDSLADFQPLALPTDQPRPEQIRYDGDSLRVDLPQDLSAQLKTLAKTNGVSLYTLMLSAYNVLLARHANQNDITVGFITANRHMQQIEKLIGFFVNTLPVRNRFESSDGFDQLVQTVNHSVQQAQLNQDVPFEHIVDKLQVVRDSTRHPLFDTIFSLQNFDAQADNQTDPLMQVYHNDSFKVSKFDLEFFISETSNGQLQLDIAYMTSLYQPETIARLSQRYLAILEQVCANPTIAINKIKLLSDAEYQQLVVDFNAGQTPFPEQGLVDLFSQQVAERGDETALIFADQRISYRELDERSNQLARQISRQYQQATGAALQPDSLIAMYMERSPEMIIAMLAILKAGGAYVPILTSYPEQRVNFILADTAAALVLTDQQTALPDEASAKVMKVDPAYYGDESTAALDNTGDINDLAYVIYTSGTTGQPKGVMVEQRSVVSLVKDSNYLQITPNDAMMQLASAAFDAATFEIWGALLNGARLYLPSDDKALVSNSDAFKQTLVSEGISILWLTKTLFETLYLADKSLFGSLNSLLVGGEALDAKTMAELKRHPQRPKHIINGYGPTESTTFTTTFDCDLAFDKNVPIGKPINGRQVYILDDSLNPVPQGVMGELYIGGAGLARGYLNQPALTAQRFIESPFIAGQKLYRSGDLVRLRNDGQIEYHGRNDNQVKIRGFRIELGEIEQVLGQFPGIVQGVVTVFEHQANKRLVGYFRAANGAVDMAQLQQHLAQNLPEYMVPSLLIPVEQFALTSNGKLDTQALPQPSFISADSYVAPANELEQRLCAIVEAVLSLPQVGVADDFFRIGGDSILSIQLSSRLKKAGFDVAVKDVFRCKTVRRLAAFAESNEGKVAFQAEQGQLEGNFDLLPIQQWFFDHLDSGLLPAYHHWNQSFMLAVPQLDCDKLTAALNKLAQHHDILRCRFNKLDGSYQQSYQLDADLPALKQLDASHQSLEQIGNTLTQWQAEFELFSNDAKPLWSVGYVENVGEQRANYLFFAAHHLIIDAVSWRILAEDLRALYQGESLLPKTASYRAWVNAVQAYGRDNAEQQRYWQGLLHQPSAYPTALATVQHQQIEFSSQLTQDLLKLANRAYNTDINDLLLSALAAALQGLSGQGENLITLEGHGREAIDPTLETARTVGWFTTMYPVKLEHHQDCATAIKTVKESLRQVPDKGIGFGVLNTQAMTDLPPICFNYLGVLDGSGSQNQAQWQLSDMTSGKAVDSRNIDDSLLSLNGMVIEGRLQFMLDGRLSNDAMAQFGERFKARLTELTEHCVAELAQGRTHHTPVDFELDISVELFDQLFTDEIEGIYPANSLQQGFIYHALSQADDDAYRVQMLIDYPDAIDVGLFEQAWRLAVASYPILRTSFNWTEKPIQLIHKTGELDLRCHDCTDAPDKVAAVKAIQQTDRAVGFDLSQPRLLRLHLIKLSDSQYTLLKSDHHSITDGWSLPILLDKVHSYYAALINQAPINVVVDGAYEEAQRYYQSHKKESKTFWQGQLQQMQAANDLNPMFSRPMDLDKARTVRDPQHYDVILATAPLKRLASNQGVTLNTLVQFAWHKLITIYTGDSQSIVGTTVSGRAVPVANIEQSVGLYINTLPLIVNWDNDNTVAAQLEQINQSIAEINSYAFEPLSAVQKDGRAFHSLLVYENYPSAESTEDRPLHPQFREGIEKLDYPIALVTHEQDEQLHMTLSYEGEHLTLHDAKRLGAQLSLILQQLPSQLEQHHGRINILQGEEYQALVVDYNQTAAPIAPTTVSEMFVQQCLRTPNQTALIFGDQTLSYCQLDKAVNQLAHYLLAHYPQTFQRQPEQNRFVALYLDRSLEMIVSILAIMKAGAAYVPLDPEHPQERIGFILQDTQAKLVLTQADKQASLASIIAANKVNAEIIAVDEYPQQDQSIEPLAALPEPRDLAYVIYTSGTTGKPKGVMIEHRSLVNRLVWMQQRYPLHCGDRVMQKTPYSFDVSVWELLWANLYGAAIVIAKPQLHKDPESLQQLIVDSKISVMHFVPSMFTSFLTVLQSKGLSIAPSLRHIFNSGEALSKASVDLFYQISNGQTQLNNLYGPTETTIDSTYFDCSRDYPGVPIGKPVANTQVYILDQYLNPVPKGVVGELFIGGAGVARGYLNRPELNQERFISNPFASESDQLNGYSRLYKTGDLVRMLADGNIDYMGRNDFQIKLRGLRIELGEIENAIDSHPLVTQSVVVAHAEKAQDNKILVGYFSSTGPVDEAQLRQHLAKHLPEYMLPSLLIGVDQFALSANGKLDRKALPKPQLISEDSFVAPTDELEQQLCAIVEGVLNLPQVGLLDDFFKIGGDSILSIQLSSRLKKAGFDVSVKDVFEHKTVANLAKFARLGGNSAKLEAEQDNLHGQFDLLPVQQWFLAKLGSDVMPAPNHWNQAFMIGVPALDIERLSDTIAKLAAHHDMLRCTFVQHNGVYRQHYHNSINLPQLQCLDAADLTEQQAVDQLTQWQSHFDIFNDKAQPLWTIGYIYNLGEQRNSYVFFAAHHLIIDAVSWRIVMEDLQALYQGEPLLPKTSSYRAWVAATKDYAEQNKAQQRYWNSLLDTPNNYPVAQPSGINRRVSFSKTLTQQLLNRANQAYNCDINDLLLSALAPALAELTEQPQNLITLEGHGRESIDANLDTSRTLGWFTTMYPVRLEALDDCAATIKGVKESLHQIPDKGLGFGALIGATGKLPPVSFNYLGVLNGADNSNENETWQLCDFTAGEAVSSENSDDNLLNINGMVMDGELHFMVDARISEALLARFCQRFKQSLENIVQHCISEIEQGHSHLTPSDFGLDISLNLFDQLFDHNIEGIYPANSLQQGFIYHSLTHADDDAYRVQIRVDYPDAIEVKHFEQAWQLAVQSYPILRTSFNWAEKPLQRIHKTGQLAFTFHDVSDADDIEQAIVDIRRADREQAFDLSQPGLLRLHLIKRNESGYTLLKSSHHSISDGWSVPLLLDCVHHYYGLLINGDRVSIFIDSAYPQAQRYYQSHQQPCKRYWDEQRKRMRHANDLNPLFSRAVDLDKVRTVECQRQCSKVLNSEPLKQLTADHGITLNTLVQFAWHKLIVSTTGDKQSIVGTTVSGRAIPVDNIENSVGLYINTLPLMVDWDNDLTVLQQLQQINQLIAELNSYAFEPLSSLQCDGGRAFHSLLVYENYPVAETPAEAPLHPQFRGSVEKVDYPISLLVHHQADQLHIAMNFDGTLLDDNDADQLLEKLSILIERIPSSLDGRHDILTMVSDQQYQALVIDYNQTDHPYCCNTLTEMFQRQVDTVPQQLALHYVDQAQQLSYLALDQQANQLARYIELIYQQNGQSIGPDSLIALYFDRSVAMITAILAVLKTGAAYVPIDPAYPQQRIGFILSDTATALVLSQEHRVTELNRIIEDKQLDCKAVAVDDGCYASYNNQPLERAIKSSDLAYVIYTSGTTGEPKGVMVEHGNVCNTLNHQIECYGMQPGCALYLGVSYAFDASVSSIFAPLLSGSTLLLSREVDLTLPLLAQASHLILPAALLETLDMTHLNKLQTLVFGGEGTSAATLARLGTVKVYAEYGLTEAAITSTIMQVNEDHMGIGKPIANTRVYILDRHLNPVPQGVVGELYIAGLGVSRGYLNRPEANEERFLANPFANQADSEKGFGRLYKTGDLVRMAADGNIEYVGRNDFQIKIRGFRIELGEIENALNSHPQIEHALVLVHVAQGKKRLVGYFRASAEVPATELNDYLQQILPQYMVPDVLIQVSQFELTVNGKIDRKALPEPQFAAAQYRAPVDELQQQLCTIVQQILNIDQVGIDDDFFKIGGDSILSIRLSAQLKKAGLNVSVKDVFHCKTVENLAKFAASAKPGGAIIAEQGQLEGSFGLLPIQQWFFERMQGPTLVDYNHWNQAFMIAVPSLSVERLEQSMADLAKHHDMLRCTFSVEPGCENGVYQQQYHRHLPVPQLRQLDASGMTEAQVAEVLTQWQSEFDIFDADKPLWTMGYVYNAPDQSGQLLFFAAHHLIIDAVSWRIVCEDLNSLYRQTPLLPKTSSYRSWVEAMENYSEQNRNQRRYWQSLYQGVADYSDLTLISETDCQPATVSTSVAFTTALTQALLKRANLAYHTDINDLLLSALAVALYDLTGNQQNLITLEGHGREAIDQRIDSDRTLGWFTTMYPVKLCQQNSCAGVIKTTKESLRQVPDKGVGYGVLKPENCPLPPVSFNYLGVLNDNKSGDDQDWQLSDFSAGSVSGSQNGDDLLIGINGMVIDGQLKFHIIGKVAQVQLDRLGQSFQQALADITEHCIYELDQGRAHQTPADFGLELSLGLFEQLWQDDIAGIYPANSLQQGFIYHALTYVDDDAYRNQMLVEYPDRIDVALFKQAWQLAINTYPILRTSFNWQETPIQLIHKAGVLDFKLHDFSGEQDIDLAIAQLQQADRETAFDLAQPNLLRLNLIKHHDSHYTLLKSEHHAIADGWSLPILLDTVHSYYAALQHGQSVNVAEDQAYLQAQAYYRNNAEDSRRYWREQMQKVSAANDINPLLSERVDLNSLRTVALPQCQRIDLDSQALKALAASQGITLNTLVQFAWHKLIAIYTGDPQSIVGTTVSGRAIAVDNIESSVGLYINTLPLIVDWQNDHSINTQLQNINQTIAELNSFAFEPLASLQTQGNRLFHSLLVYENYPASNAAAEAPLHPTISGGMEKVDYPLYLVVNELEQQLAISLNYDGQLLQASDAKRLCRQLATVLRQLPQKATQPHHQVDIVEQQEYQAQVFDYNANDKVSSGKTVVQMFEQQVCERGSEIALVCGANRLTYQALDQRANQMAHKIRQHSAQIAAQPADSLIALSLDRSIEMVVAILAVMKAGAAYVPIDPDYPAERVGYILQDTQASLVLVNDSRLAAMQHLLNGQELNCLALAVDDELNPDLPTTAIEHQAAPQDLAYVIYTSGTTGKPKGVMIEQRAFADFIEHFDIGLSAIKLLSLTNYTFDIFGLEYALPLTRGGKVVLSSIAQLDTEVFAQQQINLVQQTPSVLKILLERMAGHKRLSHVSCLTGGEALDAQTLAGLTELFGNVYNVYGPSETVIWSTIHQYMHHYAQADQASKNQPANIGKPLTNEKIYILDQQQNPLPQGVVGELYIGGAGVARGYLNRPELTRQQFIDNPFPSDLDQQRGYNRLYRTGDLVRMRQDGTLEYIGRNDFQIKINGFRVELGEIENCLNRHPAIAQAVVTVCQQGDTKQLVGYYRSHHQNNETLAPEQLLSYLQQRLPQPLVPAALIPVTEFALTANGKLDRQALPVPQFNANDRYVAPTTELQQTLCQLIEQLLDLPQVGINDNFFNLGGNSILAIRLVSRITEALSVTLKVADIFTHNSVNTLANCIASAQDNNTATGESKLLHFLSKFDREKDNICMIHPGGSGCEVYQSLADQLTSGQNVIGIDNHNMYSADKIDDLTELAQHYLNQLDKQQLVAADKPVKLLGWSLGGLIALEMAALMEQQGWQNIKVYLLDTILSDDNLATIRGSLPDAKMHGYIRQYLNSQGHEAIYVDRVLAAYGCEKQIIDTPKLSKVLDCTEVVLFKATAPDLRISDKVADQLNSYVLSLPDNNVKNVANRVTIVPLDCSHDNILQAEELIGRFVMTA